MRQSCNFYSPKVIWLRPDSLIKVPAHHDPPHFVPGDDAAKRAQDAGRNGCVAGGASKRGRAKVRDA